MTRVLHRALALVAGLLVTGGLLAAPAVAAAPTITSFAPASGGYATVVTIKGSNFAPTTNVAFGAGVSVPATFVSTTQITAKVPASATTGPIRVATAGGSVTSAAPFTVTPWVSLSLLVAPPGQPVTLTGGGFGAYEAVDIYAGTTDVALVSASGGGTFSAALAVPASAPPGALWFTAVGRHSGYSAQKSVTVRTNWPQFQGAPNHPGVNSRENVLSPSAVSTLDTAWSSDLSGADPVSSTPAVSNGVVYAATAGTPATVTAMNETTGATIWTRTLASPVDSSPAVVATSVYLTSGSTVYALSTATGATQWTHPIGAVSYSAPAVVGGVVYLGSYDDNVYALDAATGAQRWAYNTGFAVYASPAVAGGRVFVGNTNGTFYALDAATGSFDWSRSVGAGTNINASATAVAGTVYFGADDGIMHALSAATGGPQWAYNGGSPIGSTPAVANNLVYYGSVDNVLRAVNATTGTLSWSISSAGGNSSPVVADGIVYSVTGTGIGAYVATYGGSLGKATAGGSLYATPVVINGHLIVSSNDGTVSEFAPTVTPAVARAHTRPHPSRLRPDRSLQTR